jgi:hypothetical protein
MTFSGGDGAKERLSLEELEKRLSLEELEQRLPLFNCFENKDFPGISAESEPLNLTFRQNLMQPQSISAASTFKK